MNGLTRGFWDTFDQSLQWIGSGVTRFLLRRHSTKGESILNAAIGGALLSTAFGGVVGFALVFALSDASRVINAVVGAILGGSLGVCLGIWFGLFVETVDSMIQDTLRTLNSK